LLVDQSGGTTGMLVANGWLRDPGKPRFVYREGGAVIAGIWGSGPDVTLVRSGLTEQAPVIGRVVPSWDEDRLWLTIEPADATAVRTSVFNLVSGGAPSGTALDRDTSTRVALEGIYRSTLQLGRGEEVGWLSVEVDPEGATRFQGDLPATIPPALAAATAEVIDGEVNLIYENVVDVSPLRR
jgi:hypothetical protein